ncbi:MAG TPA: FAD-dependent monooxygenase [Steroidobacteraceae bacterium]|jgi:putative polyketide hydroxylase|nr:FAD-dependent monooxygenase [Steroidobacteraceae bacterium]
MSSDITDVEVLIIGGGPVGLISAIQLGRAGIKSILLERRATASVHAKASAIHARTMEIYRQLELAGIVRKNSADWNGIFTIGWMTRLTGIELGKITVGSTQAELDLFRSWSPEVMAFCSQDIYEPLFAEVIKQYPSVELRLASEASAITQDKDGVLVEHTSYEHGTRRVRAQYVIAADGTRSPTRQRLGITEDALPSFGTSVNVMFEAEMEPYRAGREYGLFWIVNGDTQGAFGWRRRGNLWSYNFEAAEGVDPAIYTHDRCKDIVRAAAGVADLAINVVSILHWQHDQAVTDRWRAGRVFLAGDAAHRFPPHGGFGMNSGVQDCHNLAWKVIARLRWGAGDRLLDSYESERKPVAERNGEQCVLNTKRMAETGWLLKDTRALAAIETPEGEPLRQKISSAVPKQREQLFSQGQQFGQIYSSQAMVDDHTQVEESTVSAYRPTGHPGARAPHFWLIDAAGKELSTIDLYDGGFILFAARDGEAWLLAAAAIADATDAPLKAFHIGSPGYRQGPGDKTWESLVGVGATGALLIRPDGHVGARWATLPDDPRTVLGAALEQILDTRLDRATIGESRSGRR